MGIPGAILNFKAGLMSGGLQAKAPSVGVAGRNISGDLGAFFQIAADDDARCRGAGAVALPKPEITAIEALHHLIVPLAARRFGVDQRLRLIAPFLSFVGAADAAQKIQCAKNFGEPLQIRVVRRGDLNRRRLGLRRGLRCARETRRPGPGRLVLLLSSEAERILKDLRGGRPSAKAGATAKRERNGDRNAHQWTRHDGAVDFELLSRRPRSVPQRR